MLNLILPKYPEKFPEIDLDCEKKVFKINEDKFEKQILTHPHSPNN